MLLLRFSFRRVTFPVSTDDHRKVFDSNDGHPFRRRDASNQLFPQGHAVEEGYADRFVASPSKFLSSDSLVVAPVNVTEYLDDLFCSSALGDLP